MKKEDGRKNNGGNKNAGRKPKADEIKVTEEMDAVLIPKAVWQALAEKVKEGDGQCIKTILTMHPTRIFKKPEDLEI